MTMHRWLFVGLAIMAAFGGVLTALVSGQRVQNPTLGLELIALSQESSDGGIIAGFNPDGDTGGRLSIPDREALAELTKTAEELVAEHTARLVEIVDEYGWPGKRLVGHDGAHAAFELLRRADDYEFEKRVLGLMQKMRNEVDAYDFAELTDRIAVKERRPQVYGTQLGCDGATGSVEFRYGLVDERNVDKRREEIGLPRLDEDFRTARFKFGACAVDLAN